MKKIIHVHVHDQQPTRDSDDGEGRWVTIHGAHVHIGKGGKIDKGPAALTGKSEHEAHADGHAQKSREHMDAAQGKGVGHPDGQHHRAAAREHSNAAIGFRNAHMAAERGDIAQARKDHQNASVSATGAAEHEKKLGTSAKPEGSSPPPAEKPKAHVALHSEAEDDVKGSEKHAAEHKRLMKLYETSKQDWERNAVNRQIQNNGTAAVQHKAQGLHHRALAAHEHAKQSGDVEHRRAALAAIDEADKAHGKAGGVGYAAKQKELHAMRKEHLPHVEKADKAAAKSPEELRKLGRHKEAAALEQKVTDAAVAGHAAKADAHAATAKKLWDSGDKDGHFAHDAAMRRHHEAIHAIKTTGDLNHERVKTAHETTAKLEAKKPAAKATSKKGGGGGGGGGGSALDAMAVRAAQRAAKEAADQDPKHKK